MNNVHKTFVKYVNAQLSAGLLAGATLAAGIGMAQAQTIPGPEKTIAIAKANIAAGHTSVPANANGSVTVQTGAPAEGDYAEFGSKDAAELEEDWKEEAEEEGKEGGEGIAVVDPMAEILEKERKLQEEEKKKKDEEAAAAAEELSAGAEESLSALMGSDAAHNKDGSISGTEHTFYNADGTEERYFEDKNSVFYKYDKSTGKYVPATEEVSIIGSYASEKTLNRNDITNGNVAGEDFRFYDDVGVASNTGGNVAPGIDLDAAAAASVANAGNKAAEVVQGRYFTYDAGKEAMGLPTGASDSAAAPQLSEAVTTNATKFWDTKTAIQHPTRSGTYNASTDQGVSLPFETIMDSFGPEGWRETSGYDAYVSSKGVDHFLPQKGVGDGLGKDPFLQIHNRSVGTAAQQTALRADYQTALKNSRNYLVEVTNSSGKTVKVPLIDAGPRFSVVHANGAGLDLSMPTNRALNGSGKEAMTYRIVANDGSYVPLRTNTYSPTGTGGSFPASPGGGSSNSFMDFTGGGSGGQGAGNALAGLLGGGQGQGGQGNPLEALSSLFGGGQQQGQGGTAGGGSPNEDVALASAVLNDGGAGGPLLASAGAAGAQSSSAALFSAQQQVAATSAAASSARLEAQQRARLIVERAKAQVGAETLQNAGVKDVQSFNEFAQQHNASLPEGEAKLELLI